MPDPIPISDPSLLSDPTDASGGASTPPATPARGGFFRKASTTVSGPTKPIPVPDEGELSDPEGSVFDKRSTLPLAVGGALSTPKGLGMAAPVGLAVATEGASIPIQLGAAALGGLAQPAIESTLSGKGLPSMHDELTSAAWNVAFQGLGEVPAAIKAVKGASEVAPEFAPAGVRSVTKTGTQIDTAMRRRQLLIQSGMKPEEATAIVANPAADQALERNLQYARETQGWYQQAVNVQRAKITGDINNAVGKFKGTVTGGTQASQAIDEATKSLSRQMPASDSLLRFLNDQKDEFMVRGLKGSKTPLIFDDLQRFDDELWSYYPRGQGANAVDQKLIQNLSSKIDAQLDTTLKAGGATDDSINAYHDARRDWHSFKQTISTLDPRNQNFGTDVADKLYGQLKGNPDQALYLAKMVTAADQVNPGVRQQFANGFLEHFLQESRSESGPIGQMQAFSKLRREFAASGKKGTGQAFLEEVFGKGSPMADEAKFAQIVGKISDPKLASVATSDLEQTLRGAGNIGWMIRLGAIVPLAHALGTHGGTYQAITSPEGLIAIGAYLTANRTATRLLAAGGKASSLYADWLLKPGPGTLSELGRYITATMGAGTASLATSPDQQSP